MDIEQIERVEALVRHHPLNEMGVSVVTRHPDNLWVRVDCSGLPGATTATLTVSYTDEEGWTIDGEPSKMLDLYEHLHGMTLSPVKTDSALVTLDLEEWCVVIDAGRVSDHIDVPPTCDPVSFFRGVVACY